MSFCCLFVCILQPYPVCLERLEDTVTIHEPLFVCLCSSTLSWFVWSVHKSLLVCLSVFFNLILIGLVWLEDRAESISLCLLVYLFVFFNLILFGLERLEDRAEPIWRGLHTGSTLRPPVALDASSLLGNCAGLLINCLFGTNLVAKGC